MHVRGVDDRRRVLQGLGADMQMGSFMRHSVGLMPWMVFNCIKLSN